MRGDIPAAAFRLLTTLSVRTHCAPEPVPRIQIRRNPGDELLRIAKRKVFIRGRLFDSIAEAKKELRMGSQTIRKMVEKGQARFLD